MKIVYPCLCSGKTLISVARARNTQCSVITITEVISTSPGFKMDNNAPTPISGLPYELIARIVNHIDSDTDVQHLTRVSRATRFYANERIWRYCDNEKLQELASYPDPVQQQFATSIREIDWEITPADRRDFSRLNFPRLQSLNIAHESGQFGRLRLNQFVQPALRELTIEDGSRGGSRGINQVSRNYIPLLVNCPDLRSLWIEIDPQATDAEFLAAVTSCRQLEFLSLKGPVCRVLKSPMFQHLACHSMLETLHYIAAGIRVTQNMIRSTMASLNPGQTIFNQLTTLHTSMDGAAARELFPRMPTITDLTFFIDRDDGIVHWLQDLPQLDRLRLIARANVPLTRHNLRGLRHLNLSALVIEGEGAFAFNGIMITVDDIDKLFGSHGTLTSLRLGWRGDGAHPTFYNIVLICCLSESSGTTRRCSPSG